MWFHPTELSAYMAATGSRRRPATVGRGWRSPRSLARPSTLGILFITGALNSGTTVRAPFVAGTAVPVVADPPNISALVATASRAW